MRDFASITRAMHKELEFKADVTAYKVCTHIRLELDLLFFGSGFVSLASSAMPNAYAETLCRMQLLLHVLTNACTALQPVSYTHLTLPTKRIV